jgi:regulator of PEP synthase PpsR (kinase-PPPase family)
MREEGGVDNEPTVFIVSDALGETAELVARAALSQFEASARVRRFPHVEDEASLRECLDVVEATPHAMVVYTVVVPHLRERLASELGQRGIYAVDLMGPLLDYLEVLFERPPTRRPGLLHRLDDAYFRRVESVEFAVRYDDGKDPRGVLRADLVLCGVSRTSKTPLSMYLANRRLKVANVPLVPEAAPPEELFQVDPRRVVGLTIDPDVLQAIRRVRLRTIGLPEQGPYADRDRILRELEYAHGVFRRVGCRVVDVTHRAVEETAERVVGGGHDGVGAFA